MIQLDRRCDLIKKLLIIFSFCSSIAKCEKPNVIVIVADDLGFNDVSFHGSFEIPTPNIDSLCYNGVILNRMYTAPLCSPSRSSLMTGKNSIKLGMQNYVIPSDEPWGLPLNEKLISNYFQDAGYRTALIGKWHLGFYKKSHIPTNRGFSDFFGYLGPYIGYYDHTLIMLDRNFSRGYDMRRNAEIENRTGTYATDLFTNEAVDLIDSHDLNVPLFLMVTHLAPHTGNEDKPMEAPEDILKEFSYIKDEKRRNLAAMISVMDRGIGKVIEAVNRKGIMNNTVILFMSDNGGPTYGIHSTEGSNFPLRGQKGSVWEGGCRVPACIYSPMIENNQRVSNEFLHITDVFPTMAAIANISINDESIDGINQWDVISKKEPSKRKDVLYNIETTLGISGLAVDGWKIVNGSENLKYEGWFGSSGSYVETTFEEYANQILSSTASKNLPKLDHAVIKKLLEKSTVSCNKNLPVTKCNPKVAPCLFNIIDDPCEMNNLADSNSEKVNFLITELDRYYKVMIPSVRRFTDPQCDPKYHNFTWHWWRSDDEILDTGDEFEIAKNILMYIAGSLIILLAGVIFYVGCQRSRMTKLKIQQPDWRQMTSPRY